MLEDDGFSVVILQPGVLLACRQFLQVTLPASEVPVPVLDFPRAVSRSGPPKVRFRAYVLENDGFSTVILQLGVLFACRRFLQVTLPTTEVTVLTSDFSGGHFAFRTPEGPFSSQSVGR